MILAMPMLRTQSAKGLRTQLGWPYTYRLRREIYKPNMALGNPGSWLATTGSGYACQADNHDDVLPDYRSFAPAPNTE